MLGGEEGNSIVLPSLKISAPASPPTRSRVERVDREIQEDEQESKRQLAELNKERDRLRFFKGPLMVHRHSATSLSSAFPSLEIVDGEMIHDFHEHRYESSVARKLRYAITVRSHIFVFTNETLSI